MHLNCHLVFLIQSMIDKILFLFLRGNFRRYDFGSFFWYAYILLCIMYIHLLISNVCFHCFMLNAFSILKHHSSSYFDSAGSLTQILLSFYLCYMVEASLLLEFIA